MDNSSLVPILITKNQMRWIFDHAPIMTDVSMKVSSLLALYVNVPEQSIDKFEILLDYWNLMDISNMITCSQLDPLQRDLADRIMFALRKIESNKITESYLKSSGIKFMPENDPRIPVHEKIQKSTGIKRRVRRDKI